MRIVADIIVAAAEGDLSAGLDELNESMRSLGWYPAGSVAPPYCREWSSGDQRVHLVDEGDSWFVDLTFRELMPEGVDEFGYVAVEEETARQIPISRMILDELLSTLEGRVSLSPAPKTYFGDIDFVEAWSWEISGHPFVMGVSAMDIDTPVLVMARMGLAPASDDE
ncbi:hypothetical protein ABT115_24140 [Streptomyces sp. NPDC001832]|uniref:hypothetical protein n=1 Tax=Streptomyces sp. NPDC001832 TaxID=3154527 RepID=UPI00331F2DC7